MSDEEKSKGWWSTVPGLITSLAAAITAVAGLVVAIKQTGWFAPQTSPSTMTQLTTPTATPTPTPTPTVTPTPQRGAATPVGDSPRPPPSGSSTAATSASYTVELPRLRDYTLGEATFTLLKAEMSPQTTEQDVLQIRVRMMNHGRFSTNFWDDSFRLIVNGVPTAPASGLNELVQADAAKDGDVKFAVPHGTAAVRLKIRYADASTEIPIALGVTH